MRLLASTSLLGLLLFGAAPGKPAPRRPVVVVTFDTLRADAAPGMPALQRLLREATHFAGARTVAPITLPAHVSLLSGLVPAAHGIRDNITPPLPAARGFPLLAEEFAAAGYATAAFVSSDVLAAATGIAAGFGRFEAPQREMTASERLEEVLAWIPARPFFLWVHFNDCHMPYVASEGARTPRELYAGEVRRVDEALGRLVAAVPRDAIVVVASDHGEGLGDHGEATHGPLCFGSVVDALLAVRAPAVGRGVVDRAPRSLVDVAPSLRRWCGLGARATDGVPLDRAPEPGRIVVTESLYAWRMHGWGQCFSATDGRFTLVESGATQELYDRASDPGEGLPLSLDEHEAAERLDRALTAYRARVPAGADATAMAMAGDGDVASPYGLARRPESAALSRRENARLVDPRERFRYWEILASTSQLLALAGEHRDAVLVSRALGMLSALIEEDPNDPAPHTYLAHAQKMMAGMTGARAWNRRAAASTRAAIERGYRTAALLRDAIDLSLLSQDPAEMAAAQSLARSGRIALDDPCARSLRALDTELARCVGAAYGAR